MSQVARHFGYTKSAVSKWCKKSNKGRVLSIPTKSSRPRSHPRAVSKEIKDKIILYRKKINRCSDVIHQYLLKDGVHVSLNSVKRVLDRSGLIKKRSPWKRLHLSSPRPAPLNPGDLVMVDTIHLMLNPKQRIYVYTLIDVYSRWAFAWATDTINTRKSIQFLKMSQDLAPFQFKCIQSDHGSEFSQHFSERIKIIHRHSRVRKPNDNSFIERFNRTIQEECLNLVPRNVTLFNQSLPAYIHYYNSQRLHMGISFNTPSSLISS